MRGNNSHALHFPTADERRTMQQRADAHWLSLYHSTFFSLVPVVAEFMLPLSPEAIMEKSGLGKADFIAGLADEIARASMKRLGIEIGELEQPEAAPKEE